MIILAVEKELELLLSEKEIKFGDKEVVVKKLSMLDTIRIASNLSEIIAQVVNNEEAVSSAIAKLSFKSEDGDDTLIRIMGFIELLGLVGDDGVDFIKSIINKSTTLTGAEIESIDLVDGIDLLTSIYDVNEGFFKKCGKKLQEKMKKLAPTVEKEEKKKKKK